MPTSDDCKVEVAVMYANLSIQRVPWHLKHTLPTTGVICIAVLHPDRPHHTKHHQALIERDVYLLIWTDVDCCLCGHDDDFAFHDLTDQNKVDWRFPFIRPANCIEFEGQTITGDLYARAKMIFADPAGGMF